MLSTSDRETAVVLIDKAITAGACRIKACAELELSERTFRRWTNDGQVHADRRPLVPRPEPANKLSEAERAAVLEACNSKEFASLPPSQIVPKLADQGRYLTSESSFYRILRADGQQHHRGRARPPARSKPPASYKACEVWTWDIIWMPGPVAGMFFYLYLIVDIFSRKIVGWEVHERESADLAATLIRRRCWPRAASRARWCCTPTMAAPWLQAARRDLALEAALAKLDKFDLIILDDITYAQKDQAESSVLFELIARRYETKSLAIAANQPFNGWNRVFPDQAVTVAAIDRLVHHATILEMNGDSYRRRTAADRQSAMADTGTTTSSDNLEIETSDNMKEKNAD
ncbi:ATP-binding protein [Roseovarius sp. D22-M7]|uniref:ATP-binding protein n=1 Tax=Roseovarius sp. D22-M7 TaxID=3127116 RepID=UPI00301006CC